MTNATAEVLQKIFGIVSLLLLIVGTIGNLFSLIICTRKRLRAVPTFVFYSFMLVNDIISLYFWNLNHYMEQFHNFVFQKHSLWYCKIGTFIQIFTLESSSWILVLMSIERYLCSVIKTWRKVYFNSKKAIIVCVAVITFFFIFDMNLIYLVTYTPSPNSTYSIMDCISNPFYVTWLDVS